MAYCCPCFSVAQTLHRIGMYSYTTVLAAFGLIYAVYMLMYILQVSDGPSVSISRHSYSIGISFTYLAIADVIQAFLIVLFTMIRMRVRL